MKIIDRYLGRELLIPFTIGIAIFTSIVLVARILKLVEMVVNRGVPLLQVLKLFSYILPAFLEVILPMAMLLAILVAFGRLSSDSELIALQASGVGLYRLAAPVLVFAFLVALLTLFLSLSVRPWGNRQLRVGLYEVVKARATAGITPKVFTDDFLGLVLYVDEILPPGSNLQGILISDTRDPQAHNTVFARRGFVVTNEASRILTLRLVDGSIYTTSGNDRSYQETRFDTYDINLDLDLAMTAPKKKEVGEMSLPELLAATAASQHTPQGVRTAQVELNRRFAIPFACLVFAVLGIALGVRPSRAVHSRGFSVSLALIFLYYLLLTLGQSLGERGTLPASLAVWLPNLLLSPLALFLLRRRTAGFRPTSAGRALTTRIRSVLHRPRHESST